MMTDLNMTIVAVANPVIKQELGASFASIQWVTNGYLLALAISLIPAGKLGDRFGHRQVFLVGVTGFALCSAAIGLSGQIGLIIFFRALQGLCGALLMPAALALLRASFPPEKLTTAIGIYGMVIGASTAVGPMVGGLLVEHVNWQSAFFVNVPVSVLTLALGLAVLKDHRAEKAPRSFDVPGMVLLSAAMFCLLWSLINAEGLRRGDGGTWLFVVAAAALLTAFAVVESKVREPLLPLRIFGSVPLTAGTILVMLMAFALVGGLFFITFYLQNVHGMGPAASGLRLLPLTGVMIVASPLAGTLITRFGPRVPMVCGMLLTAAGMFGMSLLGTGSSAVATSVWFGLLGLGLAPVIVGATGVIVGNAPLELSGVASGLQQAALQLGGSLGTAVLGAVMAMRVDGSLPQRWASAGLPPLSHQQLKQAGDTVAVGNVPVLPHSSAALAEKVTSLAHDVFLSGMGLAFTVGGGIAVAGALLATLIKGAPEGR
ncbi:MFS transporter [Streptomyces sp. NPDC002446]